MKLTHRISIWFQINILEKLFLKRAYEKVYLVLGGHIYFQTLASAVELNLFSILDEQGALTRTQIAKAVQCEEKGVRILLLGCVTLGLIRKRGELYSNTLLSKQLFAKASPRNIVEVVRWQHYINYKAMYHFTEAIRKNSNVGLAEFTGTEPTLYERLVHHPDLEKIFQDAMQGISVQANAMLAAALDLSSAKHLLDVGGGDGTNAMTVAGKFPNLRATVFDSPSVCAIAQQNIKQAGMAGRVGTHPGDCFRDPFPQGVDVILFSHFFTIWSEDQNRTLLRKCYQSLPPGGSVIIFNMMQHDSEDGPYSAALGSPYFLTLATGHGMLYTWREYLLWLREAGFESVSKQTLPRDHGIVIGRRK